ncbi:RNA-binding domain-containing protein, partial [Polyplosphaeria fusca]
EKAGVVYVGRIPHGFYEPQMKKYFSQFGTVKRLRLSRNKKTGASKHYAFVEFASEEVADIVARTMHNYLLFGHQLQCRVIPNEQVHETLFDGASERFKVVPRNKMAGAEMTRGAERDVWEKRTLKEKKRRDHKNKK